MTLKSTESTLNRVNSTQTARTGGRGSRAAFSARGFRNTYGAWDSLLVSRNSGLWHRCGVNPFVETIWIGTLAVVVHCQNAPTDSSPGVAWELAALLHAKMSAEVFGGPDPLPCTVFSDSFGNRWAASGITE